MLNLVIQMQKQSHTQRTKELELRIWVRGISMKRARVRNVDGRGMMKGRKIARGSEFYVDSILIIKV